MTDSSIKITLNGQELKTKSSATILEVINENNIAHPQLCYVPEVDPIRTCDTCIVEVDGKLMRSCSTLASDGMNIHLHSIARKQLKPRLWTDCWKIISFTAQCAITTTVIVLCIIQQSLWELNIKNIHINRKLTQQK